MTPDDVDSLLNVAYLEHGEAMAHLLARVLADVHAAAPAAVRVPALAMEGLVCAQLLALAVDLDSDPDLDPVVAAVVRHAAERSATEATRLAAAIGATQRHG
jgi:hypothetical protein